MALGREWEKIDIRLRKGVKKKSEKKRQKKGDGSSIAPWVQMWIWSWWPVWPIDRQSYNWTLKWVSPAACVFGVWSWRWRVKGGAHTHRGRTLQTGTIAHVYTHLWTNNNCSHTDVKAFFFFKTKKNLLCTLPFCVCVTVSAGLVDTGDSPRALKAQWMEEALFEKIINNSKFEQQHILSSAFDTV